MTATPPSPRTRRPPGRGSRSTYVVLITSLGLVALTAGVAVVATWQSRSSTRQLLRDYAAFAAWSYRAHLQADLEESTWLTLGPIQHREPHHNRSYPDALDLPRYREKSLRECRCDPPARPATYYHFPIGNDSLFTAGAALEAAVAAAIPPLVRSMVGSRPDGPRNGIVQVPGHRELTAFGLMPTEWGDTIVYGFVFDTGSLAASFDSVLTRASLLPETVTHGHANAELLAYEIRNASAEIVRRSGRWPADERAWPYIAAESLPQRRGGFRLRLAVAPGALATFLAGGLPRTPLPLLGLIGVLAVGAAGVALRQLRREGELARLRSEFVAGVSHELRTPLAQLRLFLDTLRLKRYDSEADQDWLVGHLARETTRLEHLVENVLALGRLERGAVAEEPLEALDLGFEIGEAVNAFAPLAASRAATIEWELPEGVLVPAGKAALRQLMLNLLDNAVKFGPPGQVVRVTLARDGAWALLRVHDQGPGVPEEDQERVWEPYYRGRSPETRVVGGSGIGLAIVRDIVTRFGGAVGVTGNGTSGAEFTVSLPLSDQKPARP